MKLHYFHFSFFEVKGDGSYDQNSTIFGVADPFVSYATLQQARRNARVSDNATVLAISSLGHMTPEEFGAPNNR